MIDTMRFMVNIAPNIYETIRSQSFETVKTDKYYGWQEYKLINTYITINGAKLSIFSYSPEHIFIEGSMPKLYYGHNILLFYPEQLENFLRYLHSVLTKQFDYFPDIEWWNVQRLDMCYAYKLQSTNAVEEALKLLATLRYPRKNIHIYPKETVSFGGRAYSIKFYSKEKEFAKNEAAELIKAGEQGRANELQALSRGVLRYEITNRKYNLKQILKTANGQKITYKDILDENLYSEYLNRTLDKLFKGANRTTLSDIQAFDNLKSVYDGPKARKYFMFYKMLYSPDPFCQHFIQEEYNATTIKRTVNELNKANVGIPDNNALFDFQLSVPSEKVINAKPHPAAAAAGGV